MTRGQQAFVSSESRCRNDGGPLVQVTFQWPGQRILQRVYSPRVGYSIARELKFNGATVLKTEQI